MTNSYSTAIKEKIEDFTEEFNNAGPFASLHILRDILDRVSDDCKNTSEYRYFEGMIHGRSIHEELGGIPEIALQAA